jgi:hypothetical protein
MAGGSSSSSNSSSSAGTSSSGGLSPKELATLAPASAAELEALLCKLAAAAERAGIR